MSLHVYWTRQLATDIPLIDEQHMELFHRVNQLIDACQAGKGREQSSGFLIYLQRYVEVHFIAEEELMTLHHYPNRRRHQQQHLLFRTELEQLEQLINESAATDEDRDRLLTRLNETVVDWLFEHVCMEDRALADYLHQPEEFMAFRQGELGAHP